MCVCVCVCLCVCVMKYYLVIKKNKILPFTTTWLDLENIILSEIRQTEKKKKTNTILFHFHVESKKQNKQKTDS